MSTRAYTPGPWRVDEPDDNLQPVVSAEHMEIATCWHHCVESIRLQAEANAKLIAAAPAMAEALKAARALLDNINEFGTITDGEFLDDADKAVREALKSAGIEP